MNTSSKWIALVLLIIGLIAANIFSSFIPGQIDLTSEKIYTLSSGTRGLLDKIEEPVTVHFYFSRSIKDIPIRTKNFASRIEGLLRQYEAASGGNLTLQVVDPRPDTPEEETAIRAGIRTQTLPSGENMILGVVIGQADREEIVAQFSSERLEYDISRAIYKVQNPNLPVLGIMSSLPLVGQNLPPQYAQQFPNAPRDWVFVKRLRDFFVVRNIPITSDTIPHDVDVLAVIHPKAIGEQAQFAIDQYVLSGKPAIVALDPMCWSDVPTQPTGGMPPPVKSSDLPKLLSKWGVAYDSSQVVLDLDYVTDVYEGPSVGRSPKPAFLTITNPEVEAPPTSMLSHLLLVQAGFFTPEKEFPHTITPLLYSSENADSLAAARINYSPTHQIMRDIHPDGKRKLLAGIIQGKFQTAFPEGKPVSQKDEKSASEKNNQPFLSQSAGTSKVVLISDVDFLADSFTVRQVNFLGMMTLQPLNQNLSFISNVVEFISGSDDLLSIRGKTIAQRNFDAVKELRVQAQKEFTLQEQAIDQKLTQVREKLKELQQNSETPGQLVLDVKIRNAIQELRDQEAHFLSQRRNIRKKLRENIEALNRNLAIINLLAGPIIIGAFAIFFFTARSKKQALR